MSPSTNFIDLALCPRNLPETTTSHPLAPDSMINRSTPVNCQVLLTITNHDFYILTKIRLGRDTDTGVEHRHRQQGFGVSENRTPTLTYIFFWCRNSTLTPEILVSEPSQNKNWIVIQMNLSIK